MAAGLIVASVVGFSRARKLGMDTDALFIVAACSMALALIGAKVLYIIVTYDIALVLQDFLRGDLDKLMETGLVFYGGLIGGIAGAFWGIKLAGAPNTLPQYADVIIPVIPLGHAFGRIGCFFGGCCYGAPYNGLFAVSFPKVGVLEPVFPVQLLEAGLNCIIFIVLLCYRRRVKNTFGLLSLYLMLYSITRFFLEFLRGDEIRGITKGLSTSQWISLGLFLCGTAILFISKKKEMAVY